MNLSKFIKSYDSLVKKTLEKNKGQLIDSLIEYYGSEYSELIKWRFNNTCFLYYIDWETISKIIAHSITKDNPSRISILVKAYSEYGNICPNKEKMNNVLIGISDKNVLQVPQFVDIIKKNIEERNPYCVNCSIGRDKRITMVSFQILTLDAQTLIHEINHAITSDDIGFIEDKGIDIGMVRKMGLGTYTTNKESKEVIFEELINDIASEDIGKIFHNKGGDFSPVCLNIGINQPYQRNKYLVEDFYNEFKDYIKKARITNNKNILINTIGKENYNEYVDLVHRSYEQDPKKLSDEDRLIIKQRIAVLLYQMKKHALLEQEAKKEEDQYIGEIKKDNRFKVLKK